MRSYFTPMPTERSCRNCSAAITINNTTGDRLAALQEARGRGRGPGPRQPLHRGGRPGARGPGKQPGVLLRVPPSRGGAAQAGGRSHLSIIFSLPPPSPSPGSPGRTVSPNTLRTWGAGPGEGEAFQGQGAGPEGGSEDTWRVCTRAMKSAESPPRVCKRVSVTSPSPRSWVRIA